MWMYTCETSSQRHMTFYVYGCYDFDTFRSVVVSRIAGVLLVHAAACSCLGFRGEMNVNVR